MCCMVMEGSCIESDSNRSLLVYAGYTNMQCAALIALRELVGGLSAALNTNLQDVESAVEELVKV